MPQIIEAEPCDAWHFTKSYGRLSSPLRPLYRTFWESITDILALLSPETTEEERERIRERSREIERSHQPEPVVAGQTVSVGNAAQRHPLNLVKYMPGLYASARAIDALLLAPEVFAGARVTVSRVRLEGRVCSVTWPEFRALWPEFKVTVPELVAERRAAFFFCDCTDLCLPLACRCLRGVLERHAGETNTPGRIGAFLAMAGALDALEERAAGGTTEGLAEKGAAVGWPWLTAHAPVVAANAVEWAVKAGDDLAAENAWFEAQLHLAGALAEDTDDD